MCKILIGDQHEHMKHARLLSAARVLASVVLCSLPGTVAGFLGMKPKVAEEKQDHNLL